MIAHDELHAVAGGYQAQFYRTVVRGMAQRVVQQVAQRRDRQHRRHLHRRMGELRRQLELDPLTITAGGILNRQFRHLLGVALHTVVE
ncbi:hypothetical protein D3C84_822570 [compost metagenome]